MADGSTSWATADVYTAANIYTKAISDLSCYCNIGPKSITYTISFILTVSHGDVLPDTDTMANAITICTYLRYY